MRHPACCIERSYILTSLCVYVKVSADPTGDDFMHTVDALKAMADANRLSALLLLRRHDELCVCELVDALGLSQPRVSALLGRLRDRGWVCDERRGKWVYYRLNPELPEWALGLIDCAEQIQRAAA